MPTYRVTDPKTNRVLQLTGDSPPTEQELEDIFATQTPTPPPAKPTTGTAQKITDFLGVTNFAKGLGATGRVISSKVTGKPLDLTETPPTNREVIGSTVNLLGTLASLGIAPASTLKGRAIQGAKIGATLGTGRGIESGKDAKGIVKQALTTGAATAGTGLALEGVGAGIGKLFEGTGRGIAGRFFKTDKKTYKYLNKSVPKILEEKNLLGKAPQEVYDALDAEQKTIGSAIGAFDKSAQGIKAKINTKAIADDLLELADDYDTPSTKAISDGLLELADDFDKKNLSVGQTVTLFRKYNKLIGGRFGKDTPAANLEANIKIRGKLLDQLNKVADQIPEFAPLNRAYAEVSAALGSADDAVWRQLNKSSLTAVDVLAGGGIWGLANFPTALTTVGAKKVLDNPEYATMVAKGISKLAKIKPVNNELVRLLTRLGLSNALNQANPQEDSRGVRR